MRRDIDHAAPLQIGQHPAHRLDGNPEIIADIATALGSSTCSSSSLRSDSSRRKEATRSVAVIRPRIIKRPSAAARLSTSCRAAVWPLQGSLRYAARSPSSGRGSSNGLARPQGFQRHVAQPSGHCRVLFGMPLGRRARITRNRDTFDRFGRKAGLCGALEAEPVAAKPQPGADPRKRSARRADPSGRYSGYPSRGAVIEMRPSAVRTPHPPQPYRRREWPAAAGLRNPELSLRNSTSVELPIS